MLIRSARDTENPAILHPEDALAHARLTEVWSRYARTAAMALGATEGWALLRRQRGWSLVGASDPSVELVRDTSLRDVQIGWSADDAVARSATFPAIGTTLSVGDWADFAVLCVGAAGPRRWTRRHWRVLESLATSLGHELWLRTNVGSTSPAAAEPSGPSSVRLALATDGGEMNEHLRHAILAAVHEGAARAGDRLPSIREVAESCATTTYAVAQAYRSLEEEGIVEKRERSGIYIASLGETPMRSLPETAGWLRSIVADGYLHQVKLPALPDLIQRWTGSARLRCACVESTEDYRFALCEEVRASFGLETIDVAAPSEGNPEGAGEFVTSVIRRADLIVTTPFHLSRLRGLAARLGLPLVVATLDQPTATALRVRARMQGEVTLVCVDPEFAARMMTNLDPDDRRHVRVVSVSDPRSLDRLDRSRPVLLTKAARQKLDGARFRLVLPQYPAFSRRFAERLAHTIIQLNLERMRSGRQPD